MSTKENIGAFYDEFSSKQQETGVNLRHYKLMQLMIEAGLRQGHHVLEAGCGIGTLTGLIASFIRKGSMVAADISSRSIEMAKNRLAGKTNIQFVVTDMKGFVHRNPFDFIVLPDVMEHIPVEQHPELFKTLAQHMHADSVLLIHIPHPLALNYYREHHPETLQIIDQSLDAEQLIRDASQAGLQLVQYKAYSLFHREPDYVLIHFRLSEAVKLQPYSKIRIILKKLSLRIRLLFSGYFQK
jgi:cyclopropane fatty-acyl-phospholipid synthase-like methyltransferase